ncbi:hypothetical protein CSC12_1254 [Klebsiella michiganensis]|nr:hypothetical protein CSC12_1254 [Klebsiella michiganensis]
MICVLQSLLKCISDEEENFAYFHSIPGKMEKNVLYTPKSMIAN